MTTQGTPFPAEEPAGSMAGELLHLTLVAFLLSALHFGTLWYGMSYADPTRVRILFTAFAIANVMAALVAVVGYARIPIKGLVKDSGHALMWALVCAATANSSDVILWQGFDIPLKSSILANLLFLLALGFGIFGIVRLARLTHVQPGLKAIKAFLILIGFSFACVAFLSPGRIVRPEFPGANEKEILFGFVYSVIIAYFGGLCWEIYSSAQGRMRLAARTICLGTILMSFGCFVYGFLFLRQDSLAVSASSIHIVLALAYMAIGLGVLRMGNTVLEMFQPDLDELHPSQPLIDIFGVSIGTKVYESLQQKIRRSEEAQSAAEAKHRTQSEFLAMMSHELRTPLTTVLAYAQLISDERGPIGREAPLRVREFGRRIILSANQLLELIDGILHFSKLDTTRELGAPEPFTIGELVESVRGVAEPLAARKKLAFTVRAPALDLELEGYFQGMRQVLGNLVVNAFKFTSEGCVGVVIEVEGGNLIIRVADTGIGIDAKDQQRIFEPFIQVSTGNSRKYGGTGLGLSISKRLIEAMRGTIRVESVKWQGAVFIVTVPAVPLRDSPAA